MALPQKIEPATRSPWAGLAVLQRDQPAPPAVNAASTHTLTPEPFSDAGRQAPEHTPEHQAPDNAQPPGLDDLWASVAAEQASDGKATAKASHAALSNFLCIGAWADRNLPPDEPLLGDIVTKNTRMFIVGATGLGKTMLGLALAHGMATGAGFLHWRSARPARVLYLDGEMASELIKRRSLDAIRRSNVQPAPGMLSIYSRDYEAQIAARFPGIGAMPPLNKLAGHRFVFSLIDAIGGADVIFFDNLMSLTEGDQKDETTWSGVLPLIADLSAKRVGQVWFDHTGHDRTRQYGASAKAWRMDSVGVMTPVAEGSRGTADVAFALSFDAPHGKARRRTPENWQDFAPCTLRLAGDEWSSEMRVGPGAGRGASLSPSARAWRNALVQALASTGTPGHVTRDTWRRQAEALGLVAQDRSGDPPSEVSKRASLFRKHISGLKAAGLIAEDGDTIRLVCGEAA